MEFDLDNARQILERTPTVLQSLLKDLPEAWTDQNEGPETWSPYDVIGHLIHGELTDWIPRTELILNESESKEFEPFDRFAQFENSKGKSLTQLLDEFTSLRAENLSKLAQMALTHNDLDKTGVHPEFGAVSLRQLLSAWVVHDLGHIVQVSRVMAKQYKEATGPWPKYLAVLQ